MIQAALSILLVLCATPRETSAELPERAREFWQGLITNNFDVPAGETPLDLLVEMNALLGSPDPVLRDDVAYGAAVRWAYRKRLLSAEQQKQLVAMWSGNLTKGLRDGQPEDAYRRSFSALSLSVMAALDNEASFLSPDEFATLLSAALTYLEVEPNRGGYDVKAGWLHAAAHTADLLKFLARSPKLTKDDQRRLLESLAKTCVMNGPFTWSEDERLAQVLRSVVRRTDVDAPQIEAWLRQWPAAHKELWKTAPRIDPARFASLQNVKMVLRATYTALASDRDLAPASIDVQHQILQTLAAMR